MEGSAYCVDCGREELGAEEAGLDEHGLDAERCDLGSQALHEPLDAELRGGVRGQEVTGGSDAGGGGDRHHQTGALGAQLRKGGAGDVDRPEQGGLDLGAERLGRHLLEEAGLEAAGVVDQHVESAEPLHGRVHGGRGGGGVGDVEVDGQQVVVLTERLA